jgi:hypothetical protein
MKTANFVPRASMTMTCGTFMKLIGNIRGVAVSRGFFRPKITLKRTSLANYRKITKFPLVGLRPNVVRTPNGAEHLHEKSSE